MTKKYCTNCEAYHQFELIRDYREVYLIKGKKQEFIFDAEVCSNCFQVLFNEERDNNILKRGLSTPP